MVLLRADTAQGSETQALPACTFTCMTYLHVLTCMYLCLHQVTRGGVKWVKHGSEDNAYSIVYAVATFLCIQSCDFRAINPCCGFLCKWYKETSYDVCWGYQLLNAVYWNLFALKDICKDARRHRQKMLAIEKIVHKFMTAITTVQPLKSFAIVFFRLWTFAKQFLANEFQHTLSCLKWPTDVLWAVWVWIPSHIPYSIQSKTGHREEVFQTSSIQPHLVNVELIAHHWNIFEEL